MLLDGRYNFFFSCSLQTFSSLSFWNMRTCLEIERLNCCLGFQKLFVQFCMVILLQEIKRLSLMHNIEFWMKLVSFSLF